jgi:ketosteroid isomerase-like protein
MNNYEKEITKLLSDYALSLNSAQVDLIPAFYAEDGLFMPDGIKKISKSDLLEKSTGNFLKQTDFKIEYTTEDIVMKDSYAFVLAAAKTSTKNLVTGDVSKKTSRDFFVLRKEGDEWKIYRYIFNNVLRIAS